mgnify:CR=1 FL=1
MRNFLIILIFSVIFSSVNGQTNKDWNGSYAGLLASEHVGLRSAYRDDIIQSWSPEELKGAMGGIFFGHLIQKESYVYGGEVTLSKGKLRMAGWPTNHIPSFTDFRIKRGSVNGNQLVSAGIGYFIDELVPACVDTCGKARVEGVSFSVGVDYLLNNQVIIGGQYVHRSFGKSTYTIVENWTIDGTDNAIEFRVGYKF